MKDRLRRSLHLIGLFAVAILKSLAILIGLAAVILVIGGNWTREGIARAAFWSGTLGILEGVFSLAGGWLSTGSFNYQYGASAAEEKAGDRASAVRDVNATNAGHIIIIGTASIIMLMVSEVISP